MKQLGLFVLAFLILLAFASPVYAIADVVDLRDSSGTSITSTQGWENITIRVTNAGASATSVTVTSTSDTSGITLSLSSVGSGVYETWFRPAETTSSAVSRILEVSDGDMINVSADLDVDGTVGWDNLTYDKDPDVIRTHSAAQSTPRNSSQLSLPAIGQVVYIAVISEASVSSPSVAITSTSDATGISISLVESSTYPGWYNGSFNTTTATSSGSKIKVAADDTVTITSNLDGSGSSATRTLTVTDKAEMLDSNGNALTTAHPWDTVTVRITNKAANANSAAAETGTVRINSTNDATGINITVTETGADTSIFEGTFRPADIATSDSNDWINVSDSGTIYAYADIDGNTVYVSDSAAFDTDPDSITTKRSSTETSYFKSTDTVTVEIYADARLSSPQAINVTSTSDASGTTMAVTEDATYKGKYTTTFSISTSTVANSSINATEEDTITIVADLDGDASSDTAAIYVDDTVPTVYSITPSNNEYKQSNETQVLKIRISDNMQTASTITVYYRIGSAGTWTSASMALCTVAICGTASGQGTSTTYYKQVNDSALADGNYVSFYATGYDAAGNSIANGGNSTLPLSSYYIDDAVPTVSLIFPVAGSDLGASHTLNLTWSPTTSPDITQAYYEIRNGSNAIINRTVDVSVVDCTASACFASMSAVDLPIGELNFTLFAKDTAGNWGNATVSVDSVAAVEFDGDVTTIPSNKTINNSGTDKLRVVFNLNVKGRYVRVKMTDLKNGTANSVAVNGNAIMYYTDYLSGSKTYNVKNDYDETQSVSEIADGATATPYNKDSQVYVDITIPSTAVAGKYTFNYTIGVYN